MKTLLKSRKTGVNGDNERTLLLLTVIFHTDGRYTVKLNEKISM